jgi:hypothetical protein
MNRRGLQIVLALLSLIPLAFGLLGLAFGIGRFGGDPKALVQLDSQYRFLSAVYVGLAGTIWWMIPRIERLGVLTAIICAAIFLGGLARLYAITLNGWPWPIATGAMVVELLAPVLILWQRRIAAPEA